MSSYTPPTKFITDTFDEPGETYVTEIRALVQLRQSILSTAPDENGLGLLRRYAFQTMALCTRIRFPPAPEDPKQYPSFIWENTFTGTMETRCTFEFERNSVLFNLGALEVRYAHQPHNDIHLLVSLLTFISRHTLVTRLWSKPLLKAAKG